MIAQDLSASVGNGDITVADRSGERARDVASRIGGSWIALNAADYDALTKTMEGFDLVLGALPGDYGYDAMMAAIKSGVDMVDVSFTPEDPMKLDEEAKRAEVTLVPDCGVAPGLSNMLVGYSFSRLDRVRKAHIMVGGLPEHPVPPLGYTITWSAEGLIDEYCRGALIVNSLNKSSSSFAEIDSLRFLEKLWDRWNTKWSNVGNCDRKSIIILFKRSKK